MSEQLKQSQFGWRYYMVLAMFAVLAVVVITAKAEDGREQARLGVVPAVARRRDEGGDARVHGLVKGDHVVVRAETKGEESWERCCNVAVRLELRD